MRITRHRDEANSQDVYQLVISDSDYRSCQLYPFDITLLKNCEDGGIADKLLGLETIARRVEESRARLGR